MGAMCRCRRRPFHHSHYERTSLGDDAQGAEVAIERCRFCGTRWLHYLIEEPHYTAAGRWWRVKLPPGAEVPTDEAKCFIEAQPEGFCGGSRFQSTGFAVRAPIRVA